MEGAKLKLIDYWCDVPFEHIVAIGSRYNMLLIVHITLFSCTTYSLKFHKFKYTANAQLNVMFTD